MKHTFISKFQEPPGSVEAGSKNGTMTKTGVREEADADPDITTKTSTYTFTEGEGKDTDDSRQPFGSFSDSAATFIGRFQESANGNTTASSTGTQTRTDSREAPDKDPELATQTITETREEPDSDPGHRTYAILF